MRTKKDILNDLGERNSEILKKDGASFRNKLTRALEVDDYIAGASGTVATVLLKKLGIEENKHLVEVSISIYTLVSMILETEEIFDEQLKPKT